MVLGMDEVISKVAEALQHALTQISSDVEKRLVAQEFWHSLNRKKIIPNWDVEKLIQLTIREVTEDYKKCPFCKTELQTYQHGDHIIGECPNPKCPYYIHQHQKYLKFL